MSYSRTGKDTFLGASYRPTSLSCPPGKLLECLILPNVNMHLLSAQDQHSFRPGHSTTSALLQLTTDIEMGFNQMIPPDRTICVAVALSAAFVIVCHNILIFKINSSNLPSHFLDGCDVTLIEKQAKSYFKGVMYASRKVNTGDPQGSKLYPSLFSFYIADMPRSTEHVKQVCYAGDITVWASGVQLSVLEHRINDYLEEITAFHKNLLLRLSTPKSTVRHFSLLTQNKPRPTRGFLLKIQPTYYN